MARNTIKPPSVRKLGSTRGKASDKDRQAAAHRQAPYKTDSPLPQNTR